MLVERGNMGLMSGLETMLQAASRRARAKRAQVFRRSFQIGPNTRILDIGSGDGAAVAAVLAGTGAQPRNVYIADIHAACVQEGARRFGFVPVRLSEFGRLPFKDACFDTVYCSSVIEHVTVPKRQVWEIRASREFRNLARRRQVAFAKEIRRIAKSYYVQTPERWFPIESHTWLPFFGYLPRSWQLRIVPTSNRYWVKPNLPDWCLLTAKEMQQLFPDAQIQRERFMGWTKSIMAIRT